MNDSNEAENNVNHLVLNGLIVQYQKHKRLVDEHQAEARMLATQINKVCKNQPGETFKTVNELGTIEVRSVINYSCDDKAILEDMLKTYPEMYDCVSVTYRLKRAAYAKADVETQRLCDAAFSGKPGQAQISIKE